MSYGRPPCGMEVCRAFGAYTAANVQQTFLHPQGPTASLGLYINTGSVNEDESTTGKH